MKFSLKSNKFKLICFLLIVSLLVIYINKSSKKPQAIEERLDYCKYEFSFEDLHNSIDLGSYSFDHLESNLTSKFNILFGGQHDSYYDQKCVNKFRIAIVIAYKNRLDNLKIFLNNMHQFLIKQKLTYGVYLVEPEANLKFNRGLLMNIGFIESLKESKNKWNCFFFHDVDTLPERLDNYYTCSDDLPIHYARAVSKFNYKIDGNFADFFGAVNAFTADQFIKVNGFSNQFFGWGGEDDALLDRVTTVFNANPIKKDKEIGRYKSLNHKNDFPNPLRFAILNFIRTFYAKYPFADGLYSAKHKLISIQKYSLYTKFIVSYNQKDLSLLHFKQKK